MATALTTSNSTEMLQIMEKYEATHIVVCADDQIKAPWMYKLAELELGGIPLATGLFLQTGKKCLYVRKVPKTYGTCNLVEGEFNPGEIAVVVEDVITTAGQVCKSVKQMRELGLIVQNAICVIDRQQGGRENLANIGCSLAPVFTLDEL